MARLIPDVATFLFALLFSASTVVSQEIPQKPIPPGLGDPGKLMTISIMTGRTVDDVCTISGRDASQQLIVSGHYETGQLRDLTRDVSYSPSPQGIVNIDSSGHVTPITEGHATIYAKAEEGHDASIQVRVTHIQKDLPVNFPNQIVPIFTKYGCNSGGCHGKSSGQNGFRLSLLGFVPDDDHAHLTKEGRGRRNFPAAPERSLLLLKATGMLPHGGGQLIAVDSPAYHLLVRWLEQGMPYGNDDHPQVIDIDVFPQEQLMSRNTSQQILVVAHYTDGSTKDVTRMTQFDSNDVEMAECNVTGLVTVNQLTGSVAIMARYLGHVGVFRSTIPLGAPVDNLHPSHNFVDELVGEQLKKLGLPISQICDDAIFLRRVTIDIAGRLPSITEAESFLNNDDIQKRAQRIDQLLESGEYAEYFANKWSAVLRNKRKSNHEKKSTYAFHDWIRTSFYQNKPYDQFVREILASSGEMGKNPPTAWYREAKDQSAQLENTAQLFLGLRIECARCHHHPFEKWSQDDYYGFAAFFSRVGRKKGRVNDQDRIFHNVGTAQFQNPKTGEHLKPTGLGSKPLTLHDYDDPRHALVDWMASQDNPFFARALVNRYWKHFFGRGLVDPEDDMRVTNPATNPELLDALAGNFIESNFDLKQLIRTICNSNTYQLSAEPNEWNHDDKQNFSRYNPSRLSAELLLDSIDQMTNTTTEFSGVPIGTRAVQLPDNAFQSYFLTVFGRPESNSACECERSSETNLAQSLHLLNSTGIQGKLTDGNGRAAMLAEDKERDDSAKIREIYLMAFSREPLSDELSIGLAYIEKCGEDKKRAYEDIIWTLINTKEFLFNH